MPGHLRHGCGAGNRTLPGQRQNQHDCAAEHGFSEDFSVLREYLYEQCGHLWFSSFGRIPSALFSFDTRVRNTVYLAKRSTETAPSRMTTRLHRWFDAERPFLFDTSALLIHAVPLRRAGAQIGNARLVRDSRNCLSKGDYRLASDLSPTRKGFPLHFKQTAYNWLTFCVEQPPVIGLMALYCLRRNTERFNSLMRATAICLSSCPMVCLCLPGG